MITPEQAELLAQQLELAAALVRQCPPGHAEYDLQNRIVEVPDGSPFVRRESAGLELATFTIRWS